MYTVYVLLSESGKLYIGQTNDIKRRLIEHNSGVSTYTKRAKQWTLVHQELFDTRSEAMQRELELKTGKGRDFIKHLIQNP
jgi:putative endonuclease